MGHCAYMYDGWGQRGLELAPVRALFATPQNAPPAERICILCTVRLTSFVRRESDYLLDYSQLMTENTVQTHIESRICRSCLKFGGKLPLWEQRVELTKAGLVRAERGRAWPLDGCSAGGPLHFNNLL